MRSAERVTYNDDPLEPPRCCEKGIEEFLNKICAAPLPGRSEAIFGGGRVTDLQQRSPLAQSSARSDDQQHVALVRTSAHVATFDRL